MDGARRRSGLDFGAEIDQRLEEARLRRIAVIVGAADLHQPGGEFGHGGSLVSAPSACSTRRTPPSATRSAAGVTWPPPASSVLIWRMPARCAAAVRVMSP